MVKVHMSRMTFGGPDALDVTRSGNHPTGVLFAPSWGLVQPYLNARQAGLETLVLWRKYEADYRAEMEHARKVYPLRWSDLLSRESVTLLRQRAEVSPHCACRDARRAWSLRHGRASTVDVLSEYE